MSGVAPEWVDPTAWVERQRTAGGVDVERALARPDPDVGDLAALLSASAGGMLDRLAERARALTRSRFGRTVTLYAPLYLSNHCSSGCVYCGFASDRPIARRKLSFDEIDAELRALRAMGLREVLLLTGERTPEAGIEYLLEGVRRAALVFDAVWVEAFPMSREEYRCLADAGCIGVTLYQETYDPAVYERLHRWGPKKSYQDRVDAPEEALRGGIRLFGMGALLGLADPAFEALALFRHARFLQKRFWKVGISISFPRVRPQCGGFQPPYPVSDRFLAQMIWAFRVCLPDVPLVLSTRERSEFRDGMAGVGVSKMSVASRTSVGGYSGDAHELADGQFDVSDRRDVDTFCTMLRSRGLAPVLKNWDAAFR
jgi:2-iminoacetate synthase